MFIKKLKGKCTSIKHRLNLIRLNLYGTFKKNLGISSSQEGELLIVSLTTYHKRLSIVHLTIESLMNQSRYPNKIILWLAKEDLGGVEVPNKITRLESRGLEVRVVDENIRSYKKLIYTLQEYPQSKIITCDDDVIYPTNFIEGLYQKNKSYPKHVIAYRCTLMSKTTGSSFYPYLQWARPIESTPSFDLFPTGVGGILYPPNSLNEIVLNKELFLDLAPFGDDIWFKAMALLNKTKTVTVNNELINFPLIKGSQDDALWHSNVLENENDKQLKKVFDYFKLYDLITKNT